MKKIWEDGDFSRKDVETGEFKSRSRDLARDSGQRQLTSSKPNPCASSRSVYLSGGLTPATETKFKPTA